MGGAGLFGGEDAKWHNHIIHMKEQEAPTAPKKISGIT